MKKCDFCAEGPRNNPENCPHRGHSECDEAAERYMKVCISRNQKTTTTNKNVNVHKNTHHSGNKGGKKR
jgi:hypothetical protein